MRFKQTKSSGSTIYYADKLYEEEVKNGETTWRSYIGDVAVVSKSDNGLATIRYTHRDRLGSARLFTDRNGNVEAQRNFDPFGKPREASGGLKFDSKLGDLNTAKTRRGFTDHEHLDDMELIHMNGRVYDYNLGRFMSVDPFIQDPASSQSINPYSYIMNNPLAGTDPTGYMSTINLRIWDDWRQAMVGLNASSGSDEVSNGNSSSGKSIKATETPDIGSQKFISQHTTEQGESYTVNYTFSSPVNIEVAISGTNQKASEFDFSESGVKWLKNVEKERLKPYDDATGKEIDKYTEGATIGIGHLITSKKEFAKYKDGITGDQSKALLKSDLSKFISTVRTNVTAEINQDQFNALVILAYNIGESGFKSSSALKMINNSSLKPVNGYGSIEKAWKAWNKETVNGTKQISQGLINRRKYEWKIYSEGKYETW